MARTNTSRLNFKAEEAQRITPEMIQEALFRNTQVIMRSKGITAQELIRRIGRTETTPIARIIKANPYTSMLYRLSKALEVEPDVLISLDAASDVALLQGTRLMDPEFRQKEREFRNEADSGNYLEAMESALCILSEDSKLYIALQVMRESGMSMHEIIESLSKYISAKEAD